MPKTKKPPVIAHRLRLPTASSLSRAVRCPASQSLRRVSEPTSESAQRGTNIHRFLEVALRYAMTGGSLEEARAYALKSIANDPASSFTPEQLALCEVIDLTMFPPGCDVETALGYDERTHSGTLYDILMHRDYPQDGLFHCTADVLGMLDDETVYVGDVKTGDHEPASESWQLKLCAIAAAAYVGAKRARVEMLRLWPSGKWSRDPHDITAEEMKEIRATLKRVVASVKAGSPEKPGELAIGPHCTYCPALRLCPAQTAMVRAMEPTLAVYAGDDGLTTFTGDGLAEVFLRLQRYEAALKLVRSQLETIVENAGGEIATESGKVLRLASEPRRQLRDGHVPLLLERFGADCHAALSASISKLSTAMLSTLNDAGLVGFSSPKPSLKLVKAR